MKLLRHVCPSRVTIFALLAIVGIAPSPLNAKEGALGPKLGLQTWTLRHMSFEQVVEFAAANQIQDLQLTSQHLDPNASLEEIRRKKALLDRHGLRAYAFGVNATTADEEANRKLFEFARLIGAQLIIVEPALSDWDSLEALVKEYDIKLAIHNHGRGSIYGDPKVVREVLATRDPRIGVCLDVGWVTGAGFDAAEVFRKYHGRVYDVHFKDKEVKIRDGQRIAVDTQLGRGDVNFSGLFAEMRKVSWSGVMAIETDSEAFAANPQPFVAAAAAFFKQHATASADREDWVNLFNGQNLSGWMPKIAHHDLGENFGNTFRVEDGLLKVRYDRYKGFNEQFGHLFYKTPFSYYRLVLEYRFLGNQAPQNPGAWALRNSGVMVHSQDPKTMQHAQGFPISIEAQFLGGLSDGKPRPTLNVCTPGTEILYGGRIYPEHCLESSSKTYDGDQWVRAELLVLGSGSITHFVNGEQVLEYALPQYEHNVAAPADARIPSNRALIEGGYIALQSESHPIDFRKVELLNLAGCMDPKAANFKSYYVKSVPEDCVFDNVGGR